VLERKDRYQIFADLPGLTSDDVTVQLVSGRFLRISVVRKSDATRSTGTFHLVERLAGKFERIFELPTDASIDSLLATMDQGVLKVDIPKRAPVPRVVNLPVFARVTASAPEEPVAPAAISVDAPASSQQGPAADQAPAASAADESLAKSTRRDGEEKSSPPTAVPVETMPLDVAADITSSKSTAGSEGSRDEDQNEDGSDTSNDEFVEVEDS